MSSTAELAGGIGLLLGLVGLDMSTSQERFTFGFLELWDGIKLVPVTLGLFAIAEMIDLAIGGGDLIEQTEVGKIGGAFQGIKDTFKNWWLVLRCAVLGNIIGIIPGIGGDTACFFAYGHAKQTEKNGKDFGTGVVEGVIAPQSPINIIVSDFVPERLMQALQFGADRAVDPNQQDLAAVVLEESHGEGADVVIVAAPSHPAQEASLRLAAIGGRINFFGGLPKDQPTITFDSNLVHYKELRVTGTTACSTNDCWLAARLVNSSRVDLSRLVSARYPLREVYAAFAAAADRKSLKIVLQPSEQVN